MGVHRAVKARWNHWFPLSILESQNIDYAQSPEKPDPTFSLLFPFYWWRNWDPKRTCNLPSLLPSEWQIDKSQSKGVREEGNGQVYRCCRVHRESEDPPGDKFPVTREIDPLSCCLGESWLCYLWATWNVGKSGSFLLHCWEHARSYWEMKHLSEYLMQDNAHWTLASVIGGGDIPGGSVAGKRGARPQPQPSLELMAPHGTNTAQAKYILTKLFALGTFLNLFILSVNTNSLLFAAILCWTYLILFWLTNHGEFVLSFFLVLYFSIAYKVPYKLSLTFL